MVIPAPFIENHYYHIFNRGNNREPIFFNEANYYYFISLIAKYIAMVADIIAYCLLVNHFHLLIKTKPTTKEAISEQFRRLFIAYSQAVNKEQKRSGSLFRKPFKRKPITHDNQLLQSIYYIHLNPEKHHIAKDYTKYKWSSYKQIVKKENILVAVDATLAVFGSRQGFIEMHRLAHQELKQEGCHPSQGWHP